MHPSRSPTLFVLAITLAVWLDKSLRLDPTLAFTNTNTNTPSAPKSSARNIIQTQDQAAGKPHHGHWRHAPFNSLLETKQSSRCRFLPAPLIMMMSAEPSSASATTTEEQLQSRFEEAMQRRKERLAQKATSSSESNSNEEIMSSSVDEMKSLPPNANDLEVEAPETETNREEEKDANINIANETSKTKEPKEKDVGAAIYDESIPMEPRMIENEEVTSNAQRNQRRPEKVITDEKNDQRSNARRSKPNDAQPTKNNSRKVEVKSRQSFNNNYDEEYDEDGYSWDNPSDGYEEGDYNDYDQAYSSRTTKSTFEWETYRSTSIVFPPLAQNTRPKAIIHFVGGTFFGSYPRKFYGTLLEDIALKCNAVVVATPIPLVLPGKGLVSKLEKWMFDEEGGIGEEGGQTRRNRKESITNNNNNNNNNPLDHLSLAETIQKEFNNAYRDVILDEYCADYISDEEVEDFMKSVPIVGIGHSLGARIQAISCSHPRISKQCLAMGKGSRLIRSGREGMIYLGFANWGASTSIPGIETLDRTVKKRDQRRRDKDRVGGGAGRRDDVWDDRSRSRRRRSDDDAGRSRYGRYDRYYDAEDLDLSDVFSDVVSSVAKGAKQIGEALTPEAEDLEFSPSPNELWDGLSSSDGWYSQSCQSNLIVQFDEDPIDQGSRLTRTLLTAYKEESKLTSPEDSNDHQTEPLHDVKFARLPGGHLTPVTLQDGIAKFLPRGAVSLLSSSYDFILKQLDDERTGKSSQKQRRDVEDVADTVASYVESLYSDI